MIFKVFATSVIALVLGTFIEKARADQSFICSDGSLVQVERGDLKRMKRTNACVAAHYGIRLRHTVSLLEKNQQRQLADAVPLPVRKPDMAARLIAPPRIRESRHDPASVAESRQSSSYRMVRVINAADPRDRWFSHTR
ncbi:MAG TPA: hypothetical protein VMX97_06400 [Hyphomicrobiaceae bacterium]|nr:hypothetical protein [Hyphomicrobiaceae bacterium]